ncbi:MrcB family domain-containing protein [Bradyrhizobium sp. AUGA SZCCT0182]|uniref:MrcB family domain-containing protein n=1 Tax=Bradyrhizobium sp. AUGA SZCCT0182 TaxID=2807667 RepID=UPI001BA728CC|nr:DUF3578 domain-containing protein [Bradyrhizobium sp. AUGA SZCCT0182]MBR1236650.1 DUF3578 domain-containing protein [Bradyrhizobium sp. AUGA SZCCT0182]
MSRYPYDSDKILAAAQNWRDVALVGGESIFSAGKIWTTENIETLDRGFTQNPDETDRPFSAKLHDQLATCSAAVKQLAAEIMWILLLCPSNISAERKRENVRAIWGWSGAPFPAESEWLSDEILPGIGSAGPGFSNHRPREFTFCLNFLLKFRKLDGHQQASLLEQPWKFAEWLQDVPDAQARQFRHMLLFVLFPDDFERVFSAGDRKSVAERFAGLPFSETNKMTAVAIDKILRQTRSDLEQKYQTAELDYYRNPLREQWQHDWKTLEASLTATHVRQAIAEIEKEGIPTEARSSTYEDGKRFPPKLVFSLACKYSTGKELQRREFAGGDDTSAFKILRQLGFSIVPKDLIGDLVVKFLAQANGGEDLRTSEYPKEYRSLQIKVGFGQGGFSRVPWIAFLGPDQKVSDGIYPVLLYYREAKILILALGVSETNKPTYRWKTTEGLETVAKFMREKHSREAERYGDSFVDSAFAIPDDLHLANLITRLDKIIQSYDAALAPTAFISSGNQPSIPDVTAAKAAQDVFIEKELFDQLLERLELKKNIVLQGPPGVGKTFLARRLAQAFVGTLDANRTRVVQFHASYAYEDFVQGYRPDGKGGFERKDGVFIRFCRRALADPGRPYVFVIDEINRANLSKVFGELLMLIESDKRSEDYAVELAYSTEEDARFHVPSNVHIIGLMNSADRSLALVDYALRRRFDFFDIKPGFGTVQFRAHLIDRGIPEELVEHIKGGLSSLNKAISEDRDLGPGFSIGHSFFCDLSADEDAEDAYNQVINLEIVPLLREYWYEGAQAEDWRSRLLKA